MNSTPAITMSAISEMGLLLLLQLLRALHVPLEVESKHRTTASKRTQPRVIAALKSTDKSADCSLFGKSFAKLSALVCWLLLTQSRTK